MDPSELPDSLQIFFLGYQISYQIFFRYTTASNGLKCFANHNVDLLSMKIKTQTLLLQIKCNFTNEKKSNLQTGPLREMRFFAFCSESLNNRSFDVLGLCLF